MLAARAERVALVRDFVATVVADGLSTAGRNPWYPGGRETTLSCLHEILEDEWEHLRFATYRRADRTLPRQEAAQWRDEHP